MNNSDVINPSLSYPDYTIQFWVFLVLFCIFIWVIYKKNFGSSTNPVEVNIKEADKKRSYGTFDTQSTTVTEVPIEDINIVNFDNDKVKAANTKGDKLSTNQDPKELAKKLKKLKK